MTYSIPLGNGWATLVDRADFLRFGGVRWHLTSGGYAARDVRVGRKRKKLYLHREILGLGSGLECDHKSGDKLDNRRRNLRPATRAQNCRNRTASSTTGYKGVSFKPRRKKPYLVRISVDGRVKVLGYFRTALEAAMTYNAAAIKLHKRFANLNKTATNEYPTDHRPATGA